MFQMLQDEHPFVGVGGQQRGHHGCFGSGGEPQGGHLTGVPLVGARAVDELLHHHRSLRQLDAPHTRTGAAVQYASAPGGSQLGPQLVPERHSRHHALILARGRKDHVSYGSPAWAGLPGPSQARKNHATDQ
ncbi:hypothetical protein GCM10010353_37500 [Streptomyces chryseus]|nr:hypothetical protein GCM10010353_37500 [Streptomyces chryseus]